MRISGSFALALLLVLTAAEPALAYLDPGTGSYVFQAAAAVVISAAFFVKTYWRKVRDAFRRRDRIRRNDDRA